MKKFKGIIGQKLMLGFVGIFLFALLLLPSGRAEAAAKKPTCAKKMTAYIYTCRTGEVGGQGYYMLSSYSEFIYIKNLSSKAKITNIKSSNKNVTAHSGLSGYYDYADDEDEDGDGDYEENVYFRVKAIGLEIRNNNKIKPGDKTTISFTVKQGGKSYKLSCRVTFKKMPSPVKTLKIGKENYASFFKGYVDLEIIYRGEEAKITVKAASGYKIESIYYFDGERTKKIKNGTTIDVPYLEVGADGDFAFWEIIVYYRMKKKPVNYQKPLTEGTKSLLYGSVTIDIYS